MNRYISNTLYIFFVVQTINAFQMAPPSQQHHRSFTQSSAARYTGSPLAAKNGNEEGSVEEYKNAATSILSKFMQSSDMKNGGERPKDPLGDIDFEAPKVRKMNLDALASMLDAELYEKEWFVTGQVNPSFFAEDFEFQDPDVKLSGIEGALWPIELVVFVPLDAFKRGCLSLSSHHFITHHPHRLCKGGI
jgi:hypothetical protein